MASSLGRSEAWAFQDQPPAPRSEDVVPRHTRIEEGLSEWVSRTPEER